MDSLLASIEWNARTLVFAVPVAAIVAGAWIAVEQNREKARVEEEKVRLKQQMVERGMSADEIERVLAAGEKAKDGDQK